MYNNIRYKKILVISDEKQKFDFIKKVLTKKNVQAEIVELPFECDEKIKKQVLNEYIDFETMIIASSSDIYNNIYRALKDVRLIKNDIFTFYSFGILVNEGSKIRYTYLSNEEIIDLHEQLLGMLKYIDKVCERENIPYILHGGSMLGAIRHKGFIPWDDDMDILMLREDYERFISVIKKENNTEYKMVTFEEQPKSFKYLNEGQFIKENTLFADRYPWEDGIIQNLSIDILPLDKVVKPNSIMQKIQKKLTILFNYAYKLKNDKNELRHSNNLLYILMSKLPDKMLYTLNKKVLTLFNKTDAKYLHFFTAFNNFDTLEKKTFELEDITCRKKVPFEDTMFYVPENYDKVLMKMFGDSYMKMPDSSKKMTHAIFKYETKSKSSIQNANAQFNRKNQESRKEKNDKLDEI